MNPVFLKDEGQEDEDEEGANEVKEITENCVELLTKVNKVLAEIIRDNHRMKDEIRERKKLGTMQSLSMAFKQQLESQA